jgi:hypothetical protein
LLAESRPSFGERSLTKRFDPNAQWPHRSSHQHVKAFRSFPREMRTRDINLPYPIGEAMPFQAKCVSAKRVGFYKFSARLQVLMVNPTNKFGLGQVELVITAINEDTLGVKKSAHGAIAENRRLFKTLQ